MSKNTFVVGRVHAYIHTYIYVQCSGNKQLSTLSNVQPEEILPKFKNLDQM